MTTATFGGVTFDDEADSGFSLSKLVGWYDAAPARYSADNRPQANGSFRPGTIYRDPRVVSVEGSWSGSSLTEAYAARATLASLQANGQESAFTVADLSGVSTITAGLSSAPTMDDGLYQPHFKFAFDVIAADPFRYGATVTAPTGVPTPPSGLVWPLGSTTPYFNWGTAGTTGRVAVTNTGTATTYTTMQVTGGLSGGFELTWVPTGQRVRFERPIDVASTVYLNPRTGRVTIDGSADVTGFLTQSQWWSVAPGASGEIQFTPLGTATGTPTFTAFTAPAYL